MNNLLKPERLTVDPNSPTAAKEWRFWHQTFKNFLTLCGNDAPDKYLTIINLMSHSVYDYVEDCTDYNSVVAILEKLYVKTPNEIFARHLLATRRQQSGESLDEFLLELRKLSKDCNLKAVSAEQYKEELVPCTPVILVTTATNCHYCWRGYPMISLLHVFLGNIL